MRIVTPSVLLLMSALALAACSKPPADTTTTVTPPPGASESPAVKPAAATAPAKTPIPENLPPNTVIIEPGTNISIPIKPPGGGEPDVLGFQEEASDMIFQHSEKIRGLTMVANLINDSAYQAIIDEYAAKVEMTRAKIDELDLVDGSEATPLMLEIRALMAEITAIDTRATDRLKEIRG